MEDKPQREEMLLDSSTKLFYSHEDGSIIFVQDYLVHQTVLLNVHANLALLALLEKQKEELEQKARLYKPQ